MTGKNKLIHTPEGVRDIYNGECRTTAFGSFGFLSQNPRRTVFN